MRAVVVALADLGRSARMQYHAHALAANGVDVDLVGFEGTPLPTAIDGRAADHRAPDAAVDAARTARGSGAGYAIVAARRRRAAERSPVAHAAAGCDRPDLVLVQNPPAFPTLAVTWFSLRAPRRALRHRLAQPRLHAAAPAARPLASGGAARAMVRAARRAARRREPVRVARAGGVSREPLRRAAARACSTIGRRRSFAPMERAEREQFRQALFARLGIRGGVVGFIVCPTSWTEDEDFDVIIDAVPRLEERIRGWEAAAPARRFPDLVILVTGDGARRAEFERRFAGLAGAARPAARAMARARRLPARRRQRRPRPVPAPILVRPRHPDEDRGSVRRRRAGLRARLRRVPRGARAARRQRPAVLDRASAGRRPVRSVRDVSGRSEAARSPARRRAQVGASDVGGGVGARGEARAAARAAAVP